MKKIFNKIVCWFINHDWTCKAIKGIPPTIKEIEDWDNGFKDYATMYCDRCGTISKLNDRL
jgi:hypothetical protein